MNKLLLDSRYKGKFNVELEKLSSNILEKKASYEDEDESLKKDYRFEVRGDTAIVPVHNYIFHRYDLYCWWYDGTACTELMKVLNLLAHHQQIKRIILDVHSPGGTVSGVETCADFIFSLRDKVEMIAYVDTMACSAAYWIASACHSIIMSESTSEVGSVGVILTHFSYEKSLEKSGIEVTPIHAGEKKTLGTSYKDLSEGDKKILQDDIDETYKLFVSKVALYRGISEEEVRKTEAMTFTSQDAIAKNFADGQFTISQILAVKAA